MSEHARYRSENGVPCIDIRLRTSRQLFDGRDPAPFRERDLDPDAVEYLSGAVQELPAKSPMKIVIWISEEPQPEMPAETLIEAVRAHFAYEEERLDRQIRQHLRQGQLFLLVGLFVLVAFLSLAEATTLIPLDHVRQILREGLVITGWVAMWRPLEVLLYDWWPLVRERARVRRMVKVPLSVRHERGPPVPTAA